MKDEPYRPFLDTNILIYASGQNSTKSEISGHLLALGGVISVQVLNEFTSAARKKFAFTWQAVQESVGHFKSLLEIVPLTQQTHTIALSFAQRYNLAFYDAVIAAAAHLAGCSILYSEDMHHGLQLTPNLRLHNPFT